MASIVLLLGACTEGLRAGDLPGPALPNVAMVQDRETGDIVLVGGSSSLQSSRYNFMAAEWVDTPLLRSGASETGSSRNHLTWLEPGVFLYLDSRLLDYDRFTDASLLVRSEAGLQLTECWRLPAE
ncbi:MAG: hypothetical protein ACJAYU_002300 [Bradymonadia bacterium]